MPVFSIPQKAGGAPIQIYSDDLPENVQEELLPRLEVEEADLRFYLSIAVCLLFLLNLPYSLL